MPVSPSPSRLRFFGVPSIEVDGTRVAVALRPSCLVLLAMIVLGEPDRRISRKVLAADLWPDDDEAAAATKLRRHLSLLTTALPSIEACIGRDRESVWCRSGAHPWCDVVEFERGALELYEGEFMEGLTHEWVAACRERFRTIAVDGLVRRAEVRREDDDYAGAIASARRALDVDPLDESIARLEIELHGERADLAAVDAAYAALAHRLRDVDATPEAETVELVERFHRAARQAAARIPKPVTSFVETAALDEVARLVPLHRLVTLAGPGGVGKTRLALEVAHRVAGSFADGAYFADVSTVAEGDALADALARALGLSNDLASKGFDGIHTLLRNRRALFVIDNCEQIADSCMWFLSELLQAAPHVHVVATTRAAFGIRAERCFVMRPLATEAAAELFFERAREAGWNGEGTSDTMLRVAAMCERLDRLPLALELAAGMLGSLPLSDVERSLDEGLDRVRSRDPTTPTRHRSLRDVIAWSVGLLDDAEREAFGRLAVFGGSFSANAAKAVCAVDVPFLAKLVSKSVLVRDDAIESRFVFLNSVGEYARGLLEAGADATALRDAHAAWYAGLAMRSEELTFWANQKAWLLEIDRDFANHAQALDWSLFQNGYAQNGVRLAIGLAHYFIRRGFFLDGASWIEAAMDRVPPGSADYARLSHRLADLELWLGRTESCRAHARAAREILSEMGLERETARAIHKEATSMMLLGDNVEAKALLERALPLARRCGDLRTEGWLFASLAYMIARTSHDASRELYTTAFERFEEAGDASAAANMLNSIAAADVVAGRYGAAKERLERALETHRDLGDTGSVGAVLIELGQISLLGGSPRLARAYLAKAFASSGVRDRSRSYGMLLVSIAGLAAQVARPRDAARLFGAVRLQDHQPLPAVLRVIEHVRTLILRFLNEDDFALEVRFGSELSPNEAMRLAQSVLRSDPERLDDVRDLALASERERP